MCLWRGGVCLCGSVQEMVRPTSFHSRNSTIWLTEDMSNPLKTCCGPPPSSCRVGGYRKHAAQPEGMLSSTSHRHLQGEGEGPKDHIGQLCQHVHIRQSRPTHWSTL